uniref:Small ribosomal subunit protein uS3m n=1 Tax=Corynespora cassiicola TaxID=59586 RepID=A0A7T3PAJ5_CORCC|nr:ribosomal protein S3 [Corynespora cassiicola]QPZ49920.1 ribosomal protein S3 [Corynespora cassiicola]UFY98812.1 ribosomal protein S3 [Corynespora cassiicola]UFY98828.1 ribosomal protein S3 [Corynespora cassiicola]
MLTIFKKKKRNAEENLVNSSININKSKSDNDEYNKIIYYPSSSKEWFNSIYSYNNSYSKSLIAMDVVLNDLFRSYFNMLENKIRKTFKRRRDNKTRYSANRIYVSRTELKHTNTKLLISLYVYNKQKSSIERYIRKLIKWTIEKENLVKEKIIHGKEQKKNRLTYILKDKFFIFRKWKMVFFKKMDNLSKHLIVTLKKRDLKAYNLPTYNFRTLKKIIRLQQIFFNHIKLINFNKYKFTNLVLNLNNFGLISIIQKMYNKNVEIKVVELKSIHLNSDVFSSAVALKLRDRKNKAVTILRKAVLQMVKIPDLHTLITFDDNMEAINKNNILNNIKQQVVSGVRFEASGRLTRRLTAMRAVFKYRYLGSLKNIRSSFNNKPSTMLRGYAKSNSQYTLINSKTRNGTFGLKGWVSSH